MKLIIDRQIWNRMPDLELVVLHVRGIDNRTPKPAVEAFVRDAEAHTRQSLSGRPIGEHAPVAAWRPIMPDSSFRPAHEALIRRTLAGKPLPSISPLVDFYNGVSLRHCAPVGAWDTTELAGGDLRLVVTDGGEPFTALGSSQQVLVERGEIAYTDAEVAVTRHFVWRQAERAKVTADTHSAFIVSEVLPGGGDNLAERVCDELVRGIAIHFGADVRAAILRQGCDVWDSEGVSSEYWLAQFNTARIRRPLEDPSMAGFVAALAPINALADRSPGFVWRLHDATGNSTNIRPYSDQRELITLSIWDSIESFTRFAYDSAHAAVMQRRHEWFEPMSSPYLVLWWVKNGMIPSVAEGVARLERLRAIGPGPDAFTLAKPFPAPSTTRSTPSAVTASMQATSSMEART